MAPERKTNRRKLPLGGPLDWKGSKSIARARCEFLNAALAINSEMEHGLRELLRLRMDENTPPADYDAELIAWGARYNLIADKWCREWLVRDTLQFFHGLDLRVPSRIVACYAMGAPPSVEAPLLPKLSWNPFELSREAMEHRYRLYLDAVENAYRQAGYSPTLEWRQPDHFWWLAGYQCCGWSKHGIAEAADRDPALVVKAIKRLADDIGLTLRPAEAYDRNQTAEVIRKRLFASIS